MRLGASASASTSVAGGSSGAAATVEQRRLHAERARAREVLARVKDIAGAGDGPSSVDGLIKYMQSGAAGCARGWACTHNFLATPGTCGPKRPYPHPTVWGCEPFF